MLWTPLYEISIQAIVTNDTAGGASITTEEIQVILDEANKVYLPAGMKFVLGKLDVANEIALNQDRPPPTLNDHVASNARQERAAKYPGKLVVYFRSGGDGGFSGGEGEFAVMPQSADSVGSGGATVSITGRLFAHEIGHYFHLAHTFSEYIGLSAAQGQQFETDASVRPKLLQDIQQRQQVKLMEYVSRPGHSVFDALNIFDGDAPLIKDTPPDDGGECIYYRNLADNGAKGCGPVDHVNIPSPFPTHPFDFVLKPDRSNVMSYFHKCPDIQQHLSNDQITVVRHALEAGNRQHLIKGAAWADPETTFSGSPFAIARAPGHLDLFVRGADRRIKHKGWNANPGTWWPGQTSWQDLGGFGLERPAAVASTPGHIDVFTRANYEWTVQHKSWDASNPIWSPGQLDWNDRGGQGVGRPVAVSRGLGRLDLFARFADGSIRYRVLDPFAGWTQNDWQSLGGEGIGAPAVVAWGFGHLDVFMRGAKGTVRHKAWNANPGTWWPGQTDWQDLGGSIVGSPVAVSWGVNRLDLFARFDDGSVRNKVWEMPRATWWPSQTGWQDLGGAGIGAPAVVTWGPGHLAVFMRGAKGTVLHKAWNANPGTWWPGQTDWHDLGGSIVGSPAAVSWAPGRLDLFARFDDGSVRNKVWEIERATWWPSALDWQTLGTP